MSGGANTTQTSMGTPLLQPAADLSSAERIVEVARSWLGTPYHHQMAVKGAGCDCLGLIRGVYAEVSGRASEIPPPYSRDWAEATGTETMIEAAMRHLLPVPSGMDAGNGLSAGLVLIFRMRKGAMAKHAAITTSPLTMIHAIENAVVCEVSLTAWWRRRIAAMFKFPGEN